MKRRLPFVLCLSLALLAACGLPAAGPAVDVPPAPRVPNLLRSDSAIKAPPESALAGAAQDTAVAPADARAACPTTQPQDPRFVPPAPYLPDAPGSEFWYGSNDLWTAVPAGGEWRDLPHTAAGYTQKVAFWRDGYFWTAEPEPELIVSGRRLDGPADPLVASRATNGFHDALKSFMLVGVDIPTDGCWELTGEYHGHTLSFVVWVGP